MTNHLGASAVTESASAPVLLGASPFVRPADVHLPVQLPSGNPALAGATAHDEHMLEGIAIVTKAAIRSTAGTTQPWALNNTALKSIRDSLECPPGHPTIWGVDLFDDEIFMIWEESEGSFGQVTLGHDLEQLPSMIPL